MSLLLHLLVASSCLLSTTEAACLVTKCADSKTVYKDDGANAITPADKIPTNSSIYGCTIELKLETVGSSQPTLEVSFGMVGIRHKEIADFPGANKCHKIGQQKHAICYCDQQPLCNMDVNHWLKKAELNMESRFKYETGGYCFPAWGVWAIAAALAVIIIGSIIGCIICCIKCCCRKDRRAPRN